ncbi:MFS transporter [Streptomyces sp. NPDC002952]|uniref:MFS transporter n=1 Tax=Streptomyces sp. NPDC002952 TaxID=3364673 RepID=UPI0036C1F1C0
MADPRVKYSSARSSGVAIVLGNFIEAFDWLAFGIFSTIIAPQYFPADDPLTSLLGLFSIFGVGMLMRPVGGVLLGRYADQRGRKPAMIVAMVLAACGSLLISISPTYGQIGVLAPIILLIARMSQGLSAGGEWPTAAIFLMEHAPRARRGFYGSFFSMSTASGILLASAMGVGLTSWLGETDMTAWGWRIPFVLGGVLGLGLLFLRTRLGETQSLTKRNSGKDDRSTLRRVVRHHGRDVWVSVAFFAGLATVGPVWNAVIPVLAQRQNSSGIAFLAITCSTSLAIFSNVPMGLLADRVGARRFITTSSILFAVAGPLAYLNIRPGFAYVTLVHAVGILYLASVMTVLPQLIASVFPLGLRVLGVAFPQSVTIAVLGAVTSPLATWADARGANVFFIIGVAATALLAIPASIVLGRSQQGVNSSLPVRRAG